MAVKIRFECGREERVSQEYGPFPFVQLTYDWLRVGPDGDELAHYRAGDWAFAAAGTEKHGITEKDRKEMWSDVVIFEAEEGPLDPNCEGCVRISACKRARTPPVDDEGAYNCKDLGDA